MPDHVDLGDIEFGLDNTRYCDICLDQSVLYVAGKFYCKDHAIRGIEVTIMAVVTAHGAPWGVGVRVVAEVLKSFADYLDGAIKLEQATFLTSFPNDPDATCDVCDRPAVWAIKVGANIYAEGCVRHVGDVLYQVAFRMSTEYGIAMDDAMIKPILNREAYPNMPHEDETPNPGSDEALERGCTCAILDNNHGRFPPFPATDEMPHGGWWVTGGCPVHSPDV